MRVVRQQEFPTIIERHSQNIYQKASDFHPPNWPIAYRKKIKTQQRPKSLHLFETCEIFTKQGQDYKVEVLD